MIVRVLIRARHPTASREPSRPPRRIVAVDEVKGGGTGA